MEQSNELTKSHAKEIAIPAQAAESYYGPDRGQESYPQDAPDEPDRSGLVEYWRILRRRKGTLILITGIGLLAAILVTLPQTPIYQAKTSMEVLELNQNFMNMQNAQQVNEGASWNLMTDLQTQIKILQSDVIRQRTLEALKAGKTSTKSEPAGRMSVWRRALNLPQPKASDQSSEAMAMAAGTMKARASGQTKIIEVSVDSTDPKVAADYANQLLQEYIDQNMESRWKMTQRTGEFLTKQLEEMRIKLERSEDALQSYASQHGLVFTGGGDEKGGRTNISEDRLSQLQAALTVAQTERMQRQSRWEQASNASPDSLSDVLNDSSLQQYQTKLADLRRQKAELEETYTAGNPKVRRVDAQIRAMEKSLDHQRADILKRIKNEYDEATRRERLLVADYKQQTGVVNDQSEKAIQYNILKREAETNRELYEAMLQRLKEASLASALRAANVRVVDTAKAPKSPYKPDLAMNSLLGMLGGFVCGVGFIITTDRANRTLQDPTDIAFYLQTPELGMIPSDDSVSHNKRKLLKRAAAEKLLADGQAAEKSQCVELVTYQRKPGLMAESFRAALTSILFTGQNGNRPRVLAVTSPSPSEGKTTVVTNLAIAMAETGHKVLLIDADMRKPRIHEIFEISNETGLTTLLRSEKETEAVPVLGTDVPGLFVLPAGPHVAGPTNLLYSKRFSDALAKLKKEFSMILIDTPPMLQIPDARVIGRVTQGVVLVVRANVTTRDAAVAARARLRDDGVRVIGTVMNDWNPKRSPGGYYGYYDGYHKCYRRYGGYYGSAQ